MKKNIEVKEKNLIDKMNEEELLRTQAEVSRKLREYGYTTTITVEGKKKQ